MPLYSQPPLRIFVFGLLAGIFTIHVWKKSYDSWFVNGVSRMKWYMSVQNLDSDFLEEKLILSFKNVQECSQNSGEVKSAYQPDLFPDYYNLTSAGQSDFFHCKRSQNAARQNHIRGVCQNLRDRNDSVNLLKLSMLRKNHIQYSQQFGFLLATVCKSASSTWAKLILQLFPHDIYEKYKNRLHTTAHQLWPVPQNQTFAQMAANVTSMVVYRHPFKRLTSAYYDKIIKMRWFNKELKTLELPGLAGLDKKPAKYIPSPQAFIRLLVDRKHQQDCHFNLQTYQLPLCDAEFEIYCRVEDMEEDKAYFLLKTNLQNKLQDYIHGNKRADTLTESSFWESVPNSLIIDAYELYFWDFELLAYSPSEYFSSHEMREKADNLETEFDSRRKMLLELK